MNNNHLQGKTAIITGAGYATLSDGRYGSIGYGIATAFAKEGANLVITGRQVPKLEKAKVGDEYFVVTLATKPTRPVCLYRADTYTWDEAPDH